MNSLPSRPLLVFAGAWVVLAGPVARADTLEQFLGWSDDASVYAVFSTVSETSQDRTEICFTDASVRGSFWPDGMARPAGKARCSGGSCNAKGVCKDADARRDRMRALLQRPEPSATGPGGQAVRVEDSGAEWVVVLAPASGKPVPLGRFTKGKDVAAEDVTPRIDRVYWRADGRSVAVEVRGDGSRIVVAPLAGAATSAPSAESPAVAAARKVLAVQENDRGMKEYRARNNLKAQTHFKAAVVTDPGYITARYNLACVSSLLEDREAALAQLRFLAASSDPAARQKLQKAPGDADLAWILKDPEARALVSAKPAAAATAATTQSGPEAPPADADWAHDFPGFHPAANGEASTSARESLARLPGPHDEECDASDETQGRVLQLVVPSGMLRASLRDGVALFDTAGAKVTATFTPLGCTVAGASQDELSRLAAGQVVGDPDPEYVVLYSSGGRANFSQTLLVLKRRGNRLEPVFRGNVLEVSGGKDKTGSLALGEGGSIKYQAPGKKPVTLRWDAAAFAYR